jgi:uncharacterized RDD family membrane protein YckC
MAELVVETPEGIALRSEIAGAGTRVLAMAVDGLLFGLAAIFAVLILALAGFHGSPLLVGSGIIVALVLYSFLFTVLWDGRTPGKALAGVRVCDQQGYPARPVQHFLRSLFVPLETLVLIVPLPLVWILLAATPRHQRLGDLVAGTVVLRDPGRGGAGEPAPRTRWSALEHRSLRLEPAAAARFEPAEVAFLRELLTRPDLDPQARARLELRTASLCAARLGLAPARWTPQRARAFLRELYLFLREMRASPAALTRAADAAAGRGRTRSGARARR